MLSFPSLVYVLNGASHFRLLQYVCVHLLPLLSAKTVGKEWRKKALQLHFCSFVHVQVMANLCHSLWLVLDTSKINAVFAGQAKNTDSLVIQRIQ